MSSAARTRSLRLLIRLAISGVAFAVFALHIAGKPRFELIDRVENYLYDVRVRLTMPGTIDDRYSPARFAMLLTAIGDL